MGALAACGFRPLYGGIEGQAINAQLAAIEVDTGRNRLGWVLRDQLLDDLDPDSLSVPSLYVLEIELDRTQRPLAIQLDNTVTRFDLTLAAFFRLRPQSGDETLYRSAVQRVASYNVLGEPFATLIAERDAERRAAVEISRAIRTLLALYFEDVEA